MDFSDLFSQDTLNWLTNGTNNVTGLVNAVSPLLNLIGTGVGAVTGTQNAQALKNAYQNTQNQLDQLYSPTGEYAQALRQQLERKDAAAGRRSQYGPREAQLMATLAQQKGQVLNSLPYQNLLRGANAGTLGSALGATGSLQRGNASNPLSSVASGVNTANKGFNYLSNLFGTGGDYGIGAGLGGSEALLGGSPIFGGSLGTADTLGSMFGTGSFLPSYSGATSTGLFGGADAASSGGFLSNLFGSGGAATGAADAAGTTGGLFSGLGDLLGFSGGSGAAAGAGAAGAGSAGLGGGAGAAGSSAGGAAGAAGGTLAGAVALPALVWGLGSLMGMGLDQLGGTSPQNLVGNFNRIQDYSGQKIDPSTAMSLIDTRNMAGAGVPVLPWDNLGQNWSFQDFANSYAPYTEGAAWTQGDVQGMNNYYNWLINNKDSFQEAQQQLSAQMPSGTNPYTQGDAGA